MPMQAATPGQAGFKVAKDLLQAKLLLSLCKHVFSAATGMQAAMSVYALSV